jgi:hypothetical protein
MKIELLGRVSTIDIELQPLTKWQVNNSVDLAWKTERDGNLAAS